MSIDGEDGDEGGRSQRSDVMRWPLRGRYDETNFGPC